LVKVFIEVFAVLGRPILLCIQRLYLWIYTVYRQCVYLDMACKDWIICIYLFIPHYYVCKRISL